MAQKNYGSIFIPMGDMILERLKKTTERKLAEQLQAEIIKSHSIEIKVGTIRNWIHKLKGTNTDTSKYCKEWREKRKDGKAPVVSEPLKGISAMNSDGTVMDIDQYCEKYGLPRNDIKSYKLVTHTGMPFYNTQFNEKFDETDDFDYLGELKKQVNGLSSHKKTSFTKQPRTGVVTITDLHFGAYVSAMIRTPEFNITILANMLSKAADHTNAFGYGKVHVHLLGDLIESFTGLNHKNSWKGLGKGMFGVGAVRAFVEVFKEHFLDKINNLDTIKLVAGNHDRVTSDSGEDVEGGAAKMAAWGLEMLGYDVEFSSTIIKHVVDDICYILNHGHLGLTKMSTPEMSWAYGEQGKFNFVMEGHLHSRIQKLNAKTVQNFKIIDDDNKDCRRQVCPSLFTGNTYSEQGGWSTTPGFLITESNGSGKPIVHDYSL